LFFLANAYSLSPMIVPNWLDQFTSFRVKMKS
jgi:hypothetical protein